MGLLFRLGLKNIGRNPTRSVITIAAVALCSMGLLLFSVFMSGAVEMMLEGVMSQNGHIKYVHPKVAKNERLGKGYYFISGVSKFSAAVKSHKGVSTVLPRIDTGGYIEHSFTLAEEKKALATGKCAHKVPMELPAGKKGNYKFSKQTPAPGQGIIPELERGTSKLHKKVVYGRMIKSTGKEVLVGQLLANRIHACVGSKITVIGKTVDDSLSAVTLKVVGIFNYGGSSLDKSFVMNLKTAQYYMDLPDGASSVLVHLKDKDKARQVAAAIAASKLPTKVTPQVWQDSPLIKLSMPIINVMDVVLSFLVIFIGGVGLLNTMMMSVMERRQEIGIMMALGLTPGKVRNVFVFEGVVFGLVGALVGVGIGLLGAIPLVTSGISYGSEATASMAIPMESTFYGIITTRGIVVAFLVGVCTTFFGSILPAYRASQLEPVEVLRH